jgi:ABC-2 type transport system ATP-binding protein
MTQEGSEQAAVTVRGLVKRYGEVTAVDGVDLDVRPGETFGFLGPNGAGKSTTINILCTLVKPTAGDATVAGYDVRTQRDEVRRSIGLVFQESTLDAYLTAEQNLRFHADLYGVDRSALNARLDQVLEMVGLADRRKDRVDKYSGGMKRRLEIARGMLHSPRVLFLDEPTIGLDPVSRAGMWDYLAELRQREDITVFLTTHYLDEAEHCDRIAIINAGRIVALDTPTALKASIGADRITLGTADDEAAMVALREKFGLDPARHAGAITVSVEGGEEFVPRLFDGLGVTIRSVSVARPTLDDVFVAYTGQTITEADKFAGPGRFPMMMAGRR